MGLLKPVMITFLSILLLSWVIPAVSYLNLATLIFASIALTLLQHLVKPALQILFLPINLVTLGLFGWIINVIVLWLAILVVPGFHIDQVRILSVEFNFIFSLAIVSFGLGLIQSLIDMIF